METQFTRQKKRNMMSTEINEECGMSRMTVLVHVREIKY